MNNLIPNPQQTMSSTEIAQLTGKEKTNIHRDIKAQLLVGLYGLKDDSDLNDNKIQGITVVLDNRGYWSEVWLDKYHTDILVSGYEVKYRAAIVKRWHELEGQQLTPFSIPTTFAEALRLAAQKQEELEAAQSQIEADKPKVEFAMAVRNMDGTCLIEEFAKTLGIGRNKFFAKLREAKYLRANNQPYQKYVDLCWFVLDEGLPYTDSQGKSHPTFTTRITGKGQVALEKKFRNLPRNGLVSLSIGARP